MDVKLKNGDIVTDMSGEPVYIDGMDEIIQRVLICIGIKKGSFAYAKDFGMEKPAALSTSRDLKKLETLFREAVIPVSGAYVEVVSAEPLNDGRISAYINVIYGEEQRTVEVII